MGKIVKYCNACEEGFAEKFAFCPNCGNGLTAFEMSPLKSDDADASTTIPAATPSSAEIPAETMAPKSAFISPQEENITIEAKKESLMPEIEATIPAAAPENESPIDTQPAKAEEAPGFLASKEEIISASRVDEILESAIPESYTAPEKIAEPATTQKIDDEYLEEETILHQQAGEDTPPRPVSGVEAESEYRPTFVEDKNRGSRLKLLFGSLVLVGTLSIGGLLYSLFAKALEVASIDDEFLSFVVPPNDDPFIKEKEEIEKKNPDKGGGGGGGGKEEKEETTKGQLAKQMDKPDMAPSAKMDRVTNPEIIPRVGTDGDQKTNIDPNKKYGNPNGRFDNFSDGTGSGGGQGSGRGRGQGSGEGTGRGRGRGSGSGDGDGNGNGDGTGDGDNGPPPPTRPTPTPRPTPAPTPRAPAVTTPLRITSQPKALYTDAARTAQIQGVVRLRVTFNANGSIGSISPVSGLPSGLTEQAIAAARSIRFSPAMRDGVAQTTTKVVEYRFTIY